MSIDLTEAIEAIRPYMGCCVDCPHEHSGVDIEDAQALLAAALPHLERQIREQIARDIEAIATRGPGNGARHPQTIRAIAARIARTRKDADHA